MDEQAYQYWQVLHRRVSLGETLSSAEQAAYEAGCQELDAEERLDGSLERLRELRAHIAAAETAQQRLRAQEAELDARIVALEARLATDYGGVISQRTQGILCGHAGAPLDDHGP